MIEFKKGPRSRLIFNSLVQNPQKKWDEENKFLLTIPDLMDRFARPENFNLSALNVEAALSHHGIKSSDMKDTQKVFKKLHEQHQENKHLFCTYEHFFRASIMNELADHADVSYSQEDRELITELENANKKYVKISRENVPQDKGLTPQNTGLLDLNNGAK